MGDAVSNVPIVLMTYNVALDPTRILCLQAEQDDKGHVVVTGRLLPLDGSPPLFQLLPSRLGDLERAARRIAAALGIK